MKRARVAAVPCLLAALVSSATAVMPGGVACTVHEVSGTPEEAFDERPMLRHQADAVALPAMRALAAESTALSTATAALEAAPTEATLAEAQAAWRRARAAWMHTSVFAFGPAKALESRIDWPADASKLDAIVADDRELDAAAVASLGASERGLGAIEVLLFAAGDADDVADVLAAIEATPRRAELARALSADVAAASAELDQAWEPGGGGYADELATAGEGSASYPARKDGTDAIVNETIFVTEIVLDAIATPLGLRHDGVPQPDLVHSPRADASIDDALAQLDAVGATYLGGWGDGGGPVAAEGGLSDLVVARGSADLDADVRDALVRARAAVTAIPAPLRSAVTDDPAAVQRAYDEVRELKRLLASDVATAVGTTLGFSDNDGD